MLAVARLGKEGLWMRARGHSIRALGPYDGEVAALRADDFPVRVTLWELTGYDVGLADTRTDQESRRGFAAAHPEHRRCAIVPDVHDAELFAPVVELLTGGIADLQVRVFADRRDALDWLREIDATVPHGVPAWRTSRPPPEVAS